MWYIDDDDDDEDARWRLMEEPVISCLFFIERHRGIFNDHHVMLADETPSITSIRGTAHSYLFICLFIHVKECHMMSPGEFVIADI